MSEHLQVRRALPRRAAMWGAAVLAVAAAVLVRPEYTAARAISSGSRTAARAAVTRSQPVDRHGDVALVGDSLSVQSTAAETADLRAAGWKVTINAQVGRRIADHAHPGPVSGITALREIRARGRDPHTWIVELGTNEMWTSGRDPHALRVLIDLMLHEIGPGHRVVWVNIHDGPFSEGSAAFNLVLAQVASQRPDLVVADWAGPATTPGYLIGDHIHLTHAGAAAMGRVVAAAAERAAALA